eukprot:g17832.t1
MKFGKTIRTELSAEQLRCSVNYKALKKIAKKLRRASTAAGGGGGNSTIVGVGVAGRIADLAHQHQPQQLQEEQEQGMEAFFTRLELEKQKVAEFYRSREAWCFLALESTRGAIFGLTRRASKDRLCLAAHGPTAVGASGGQALASREEDNAAGELEGKFLEAKAGSTVLLSESRDLVQFVDMNMHAFRKLLKKLDKWTSGVSGREYFTSLVQTQPWINGDRAHGVLRMASTMSDHLRSLRPALALGPAAGGPCWADRIVYSVGTFDRPRVPADSKATTTTMMSITPSGSPPNSPTARDWGAGAGGGGGWWGGSEYGNDAPQRPSSPPPPPSRVPAAATEEAAAAAAAASKEAVESPSPLRFLREFGAVVVVGVYTDAAHAASHSRDGGGCGTGGTAGSSGGVRARPAESLEARCARVRPHADRVVLVDSADPTRIREILFGAAAGAVGVGAPTNNCCFVVSDWGARGPGGTEGGRPARRDVRALMEASMPVFRLPSPRGSVR